MVGLAIKPSYSVSAATFSTKWLDIGVRHNFAQAYEQNQLQLGLSTVRNNRFYSSVNLSLGEAVVDTLVMRHSLSTTVGTTLFDKALTATVGYSFADGGRLLGFEREDTTRNININYTVTSKFSVGVGYRQNTSSINYFDEAEPVFSVQLAPIRF